jgi:haloalkane dehalogenase
MPYFSYVDVTGVCMHYVEQGKGDPILFLHGNLEWSYIWYAPAGLSSSGPT